MGASDLSLLLYSWCTHIIFITVVPGSIDRATEDNHTQQTESLILSL